VEAYSFAIGEFNMLLAEANGWRPGVFGGAMALCAEAQACVRFVFALAMEKLAFLNMVPWLFARLDQPGVKALCIQQYNSVPESSHANITIDMMKPSGDLRADIDNIDEQGQGSSRAVLAIMDEFKEYPMDDTVGEGPHSIAKRQMDHCHRSKWPWVAASCRAPQNLDDIDFLLPAVEADIQTEWNRYKSVLQLTTQASRRNIKIPRRDFENRVYRMQHLFDNGGLAGFDRGGDDGDGGGDDGADGADGGGGSDDDDGADGDAMEEGNEEGLALQLVRNSHQVALQREFLASVLEVGSFISVGAPNSVENLVVFQVLSLETRNVLTKTYLDNSNTSLYKVDPQWHTLPNLRNTPICIYVCLKMHFVLP
jgi:hypothetical protein